MRKIILIGGDLASGKSTYSHFLSEYFNITLLNKDNLKEILGDHIVTHNRAENKNLSVICFELIKYFIENSTCDLIIESNFKSYEMEELKKYEASNSILSLKFRGDNEELHQRFLKRLTMNRHPVHKSQDFSNIEDFIAVLEDLRSVAYIGEVIPVLTPKDSMLKDNQELLEEIRAFLARR